MMAAGWALCVVDMMAYFLGIYWVAASDIDWEFGWAGTTEKKLAEPMVFLEVS